MEDVQKDLVRFEVTNDRKHKAGMFMLYMILINTSVIKATLPFSVQAEDMGYREIPFHKRPYAALQHLRIMATVGELRHKMYPERYTDPISDRLLKINDSMIISILCGKVGPAAKL